MTQKPYYYTWSAQNTAPNFDVISTTNDSYISKNNNEIYDLSSCSYQLHFGLKNETIQNEIKNQLDQMPTVSAKANFSLKTNLSKKLLDYLNLEGKIFYTVSGAEAVENALKFARLYSKKNIILSRKISYHGATIGALSVTGDWRRADHLTLDEFNHFIPEPDTPNDLEKTKELISKLGAQNIAALCLETITGGNGVIIPSKRWWQGITNILKENNILLICDEVICGFERTGKPFGFQHFDIKPDIITMAKGISGGFIPFGAVYTNLEISNHFDKNILSMGLTNYAHPLGLAALNGVFKVIENQDFQENKNKIETLLKEYSSKFQKYSKEVRLIGSLMAIEFENEKYSWDLFCKHNIYVNVIGKNIVIAPILTTCKDRLRNSLELVFNILKENYEG